MSRGREAPARDTPARDNPAGSCAFCGVRVPRRGFTERPHPRLCDNCESGNAYQFTLRETVVQVTPFADSRWRQASIVDTRAGLRRGFRRR